MTRNGKAYEYRRPAWYERRTSVRTYLVWFFWLLCAISVLAGAYGYSSHQDDVRVEYHG